MNWISHSEEETTGLGIALGQSLASGSILCFFGELGAGKTTFIKGVAAGAAEISIGEVISPTFTYLNIHQGSKNIYHFDLYRLHDVDDFLSMGFDDYLFDEGICCIEWSERIESILPKSCYKIFIKHVGENKREITCVVGNHP